jgi:hypothetical protein
LKNKTLLFAAICAMAFTSTIRAAQTGATHYVSGEFSDFSTTVPTAPGWVFGNIVANYNDGDYNASQGLPFGHGDVAVNVDVNLAVEAPLVMYAYPVDWLGATWASGGAVPFSWVDAKAQGTFDIRGVRISATKQQSASGLGDIQLLPIMAGWTNGDFKYDFVMNVWAPTGDYNKDNLANTSLGYWTFTPMLAASWLSRKIGTEVSIFTGVDFNTKNNDADYQSGNLFHVDATAAQHFPLFGGLAGVGATAFWMRQISNDTGSGAKLGGFQLDSYGVGPTLSYVHPIGEHTLVVTASWLPQTHAENTTKGNYLWIKAMFAF